MFRDVGAEVAVRADLQDLGGREHDDVGRGIIVLLVLGRNVADFEIGKAHSGAVGVCHFNHSVFLIVSSPGTYCADQPMKVAGSMHTPLSKSRREVPPAQGERESAAKARFSV